MNEEDKQTRINKNKRDNLDLSKKLKINQITHDGNASAAHRYIVEGICSTFKGSGIEFYTRAVFKSGNICDIYVPFYNFVFEIMDSEDEEKFNNKRFGTATVIPLKVGLVKLNEGCLLEENKRLKIENEGLKKKILVASRYLKSAQEALEL